MKRILVVHQSAELYGSDRTLLQLLSGILPHEAQAVVLLPCSGPLAQRLRAAGIEVHVVPLLLVTRSSLGWRGLLALPFTLFASMRAIGKALAGRPVDTVYSNTLAVLSGLCWARLKRIRHVWHIHEVPLRGWQQLLMRTVFFNFGCQFVCNSHTTRKLWFGTAASRAQCRRIKVVLNGIDEPAWCSGDPVRRVLGAPRILVTCIGRISWRKGQGVLLEAAERLWALGLRDIHFLFVGSAPPGQAQALDTLRLRMRQSPARSVLHLSDFREDVWPLWAATDIAVAPSTAPESFGLVAVEAMAMGRAVIASRNGGLAEIVDDGATGRLVAPGDAAGLAQAIRELAADPARRLAMGQAGREKFLACYSSRRYQEAMKALLLAAA